MTEFINMHDHIINIIMRDMRRRQMQLPDYEAEGEFDCCICLDKVNVGEKMKVLPCSPTVNHKFHSKCIDEWFRQHDTCPVCRSTIRLN